MESNTTMFDGSEENIYNVTYPLYATYMKLFAYLLVTTLVVISSSFVVYVILKNKELRNANNLLIVNLLVTDVISTVLLCSMVVPFILAYIADIDIDVYHNCDIIVLFIPWLSVASRLMILPPAVHRFVSVARPFTHHKILTKRRIILMIIALWAIPTMVFIPLVGNFRTVNVPSLGSCVRINNSTSLGSLLTLISFVFGYISSILLITISAVYLRHKIIHVKTYVHDLQQSGSAQRKLNKSQRLKELLTEQVKPTIGVLVVGGMDGICNLLIGAISVFIRVYSTPIVQFHINQTIVIPLFFLQSLSHSLSYGLWNKNVRDEMHPCYPKRSRVIVLNRQ